jgi:hypothetical protein
VNLLDGAAVGLAPGEPATAAPALPEGVRVLFFHKQRTSARLRFLIFASGLAAPEPLDPTAVLLTGAPPADGGNVIVHPAVLVSACAEHFGLPRGELRIDGEFRLHGEEFGRPFTLLLVEFLAIDPPFEHVERVGGRFVAITEARGLGNAEREALRAAYAHILG